MGQPDAAPAVKALRRLIRAEQLAADVRGTTDHRRNAREAEAAANDLTRELEALAGSVDLHRVIEDTLAMK
jgi:hypothetical protein